MDPRSETALAISKEQQEEREGCTSSTRHSENEDLGFQLQELATIKIVLVKKDQYDAC